MDATRTIKIDVVGGGLAALDGDPAVLEYQCADVTLRHLIEDYEVGRRRLMRVHWIQVETSRGSWFEGSIRRA